MEKEYFVIKANPKVLTKKMKRFSKENAKRAFSFTDYLNKIAEIIEEEKFEGEFMIVNSLKTNQPIKKIYESYFKVGKEQYLEYASIHSYPASEKEEFEYIDQDQEYHQMKISDIEEEDEIEGEPKGHGYVLQDY